jgi:hypothetical protein
MALNGEVAAHQIVLQGVAEGHLGLARVVAGRPRRGRSVTSITASPLRRRLVSRSCGRRPFEGRTHLPPGVGPPRNSAVICSGRASVVKSRSARTAQQDVAHRPAHQSQLVTASLEPRPSSSKIAPRRISSAINRRRASCRAVAGGGRLNRHGRQGTSRAAAAPHRAGPSRLDTIKRCPRLPHPVGAAPARSDPGEGRTRPAQGRGDLRRRAGRRPIGEHGHRWRSSAGRDRRGPPALVAAQGPSSSRARRRRTLRYERSRRRPASADGHRALGTIDYWFVAENRRVHKTVHHYLLGCLRRRALRRGHRGRRGWRGCRSMSSGPSGLRRRAAAGRDRGRVCSRTLRETRKG